MNMAVPFIQLVDIKITFDGNEVLKGINLSVYKGENLFIIGKSGTGKSVLLKTIIGLVKQDSGEKLINGKPMKSLSSNERSSFYRSLSYMFQDNALFDFMNIYDNIALPLSEQSQFSRKRIKEKVFFLMEELGLTGIQDKYPSQISGGMQKRVAFARALVTDPEAVLFDEPTTGLDPVRKNKIHSMIREYHEKFGFTAVIVSHDIPEIFNIAHRIAMLDDGIIKFEGTKKELLKNRDDYLNNFIFGLE